MTKERIVFWMKQKTLSRLLCLGLALALACAFYGCLPCPPCPSSSVPGPEWDEQELYAALEQCAAYGPGEAGATLKTVAAACGMLDWAEANPAVPADEELTRHIEGWLNEREPDTRELFWENWPGIDRQAQEILADPEGCRELIESAGVIQRYDGYSYRSYDRLSGCVAASEGG